MKIHSPNSETGGIESHRRSHPPPKNERRNSEVNGHIEQIVYEHTRHAAHHAPHDDLPWAKDPTRDGHPEAKVDHPHPRHNSHANRADLRPIFENFVVGIVGMRTGHQVLDKEEWPLIIGVEKFKTAPPLAEIRVILDHSPCRKPDEETL